MEDRLESLELLYSDIAYLIRLCDEDVKKYGLALREGGYSLCFVEKLSDSYIGKRLCEYLFSLLPKENK